MSGLGTGNINLLQTQRLSGVISYFQTRKNDYPLINYFPLTKVDADEVWYDVAKASSSGMTPATVEQTESPIMPMSLPVGGRRSYTAVEWREKVVFTGNDARSIRRLGTHDEEIPTETVRESFKNHLRKRLDQRMEWLRAQTLTTGGLSFTFAGTSNVFSISFNHPSYLEPTAGTLWSSTATAVPVSDIATWVELMRPVAHDYRFTMMYTDQVERLLRSNTSIRDVANDIFRNTNVSHAIGLASDPMGASNAVETVMRHNLSDSISFHRTDAGIDYRTDLTAAASSAQADIVVQNIDGFAAGNRVMLSDAVNNKFWFGTISSIVSSTRTVTFTSNLPESFPLGAQAHTSVKYLDDSLVIMVPTFVPGLVDMEGDDSPQGLANASNPMMPNPTTLGEIVSTRNTYLVDDNSPGFFSYVASDTTDPPRVEVVAGIKALPRVDWSNRWLIATVS